MLLSAGAATAQTAQTTGGKPDAAASEEVRRMIESLRAPAVTAPASSGRTRNLVVVPNTEPGPAASPPPAAPAAATPTPAATTAPARPQTAAPATGAGVAAAPASPAASSQAANLSLPIAFETNSAQIRPESGNLLGALVAAMLSPELRASRFVIEGHTDAVGSPAQNLRLSRERAEQVKLFLVTLGVEAERLRAVGKGANEPLNPRDPRAAENRRVRVVALP
jgi:outer membrane protein OmpA-like peptidoglycan-associated protein